MKTSSSPVFSRYIYEIIAAAWERDQNLPSRRRIVQHTAPDVDTLVDYIDVSFRASFQKEENVPIRFSIMASSPADAKPDDPVFSFATPLEFSEQNLRKSASAFDNRVSTLFVAQLSPDAPHRIWGFGYFGSTEEEIRSLPIGTGYERLWPDRLRIRVDAPGVLAIARGNTSIGLLNAGQFIPAKPTPLSSRAMGRYLLAAIQQDPGMQLQGYWYYFRDALEHLILHASRTSQGTTIILVPHTSRDVLDGCFRGGHRPVGSFRIGELIGKRLAPENAENMLYNVALDKLIAERLNAIAQLAGIDGALIIDTTFEVLAFGAKLTAPAWHLPVFTGPDGLGTHTSQFDLQRHGTRHQSAAALVGYCARAIAFVISADGPIRSFTQGDDGQLYCWPDFRTSTTLSA